MNISIDVVIQSLTEILRSSVTVNGDGDYVFEFQDHILLPFTKAEAEELTSIIDSFIESDDLDDITVTTKSSFEVAVQPIRLILSRGESAILLNDQSSGISWAFGAPSNAYVVYLWTRLGNLSDPTSRADTRFIRDAPLRSPRESQEIRTVRDAIVALARIRCLRITSNKEESRANWQEFANAFYFQLGYNLNIPLLPSRLSEFIRPVKISKMRRSRIADLDAPRRHYVPDLIHHYQLGISSESPMLEYISYYHIAEHWFETIFQDDLVEQIQRLITAPSFSYKRKKDMRGIIRTVSKAVQLRDDQLVINEQVALRLTLSRYIDTTQLTEEIRTFDSSLLGYYATREVGFCKGDTVTFNQDPQAVVKALAGRIYKTRNALVHSKDGSKGKFIPFTDDKDLVPEVPLMRFIGEQIIVATSSFPS